MGTVTNKVSVSFFILKKSEKIVVFSCSVTISEFYSGRVGRQRSGKALLLPPTSLSPSDLSYSLELAGYPGTECTTSVTEVVKKFLDWFSTEGFHLTPPTSAGCI